MDVPSSRASSTPIAPKRLSGRFPSSQPPRSPARDPRLAGRFRQPTGPQTSNPRPLSISTSANAPSVPKPPERPPPQVSPLVGNETPASQPTKTQDVPSQHGLSSIFDLVNSLTKVNQAEEQKERLQKEIARISKNLHRAKQAQQFPSTITLFQQQLDAAKKELAVHIKSISQHQSLSNQAQNTFVTSLSQIRPQPVLGNIPERVQKLESQVAGISQSPTTAADKENLTRENAEIEKIQKALENRDRTITQITEKLEKVEVALRNPKELQDALDYIKKIANSVAHQSRQNTKFSAKITSLEADVTAADKNFEDKVSTVRTMVDAIEDEMKNSNKHLEDEISVLTGKVKTVKEDFERKLASIGNDVSSLKSQGVTSRNSVSTNTSRLEADLETQRRHATEQITAQEDKLASLRLQQQNLSDGRSPSSEVATPSGFDVLARLTTLEGKAKAHAGIITNIQQLHSEVDVIRLTELETIRNAQTSMQDLLEKNHDVTSRNVEDLIKRSDDMTKKHTDLTTTLSRVKSGLTSEVQQLENNLQNKLRGLETRFTTVSNLSLTVSKFGTLIATHSKGIRSLEQRWANITTTELVHSMARAMQEMYPSLDQVAQQLAAHRKECEDTVSALKADTQKAQTDAQAALASIDKPQAGQVPSEQLQNLEKDLDQRVRDLSDKLAIIDNVIKEHSTELQKNLRERNSLLNRVTDHDRVIEDIDTKVEDRLGEYEGFAESINKIEPLTNKVDAHISQLQDVQKEVKELTKAPELKGQKASESEDSNALKDYISQVQKVQKDIDDWAKASKHMEARENEDRDRVRQNTSRLEKLQEDVKNLTTLQEKVKNLTTLQEEVKNLTTLQGKVNNLTTLQEEVKNLTKDLKEQKPNEQQGLEEYTLQIQELRETVKGLTQASGDPSSTRNADFDSLCSRLQALENQMPNTSEEDLQALEGEPNDLEKEIKHLEKGFHRIEDSLRGYLKRLRNAEDTVKALKGARDEASSQSTSPQQLFPNSPAFTPAPSITPQPIPKGPMLGVHQPIRIKGKGQGDSFNFEQRSPASNPFVNQSQERSQTPNGLSRSQSLSFGGNFVENRQIQNLKGKQRMPSVPASDGSSSSSAVRFESSPAPSSSAPPSCNGTPSKRDKKRKKKAAQAEENAKSIKKAKKQKFTQEE